MSYDSVLEQLKRISVGYTYEDALRAIACEIAEGKFNPPGMVETDRVNRSLTAILNTASIASAHAYARGLQSQLMTFTPHKGDTIKMTTFGQHDIPNRDRVRTTYSDEEKALREAAEAFLTMYIDGVRSGDWGSWEPEEEPEVIALRKALGHKPWEPHHVVCVYGDNRPAFRGSKLVSLEQATMIAERCKSRPERYPGLIAVQVYRGDELVSEHRIR